MYIGRMATWIDVETVAEDTRPRELMGHIIGWGMVVEPSEADCFAKWEEELMDSHGGLTFTFKDDIVYDQDSVAIGRYSIRKVTFKLD